MEHTRCGYVTVTRIFTRRVSAAVAALACGLALVAAGTAADSPTLDQIASFVAGKPVTVACPASVDSPTKLPAGLTPAGLTVVGSSSVAVVQSVCTQIEIGLDRPSNPAAVTAGGALLVLVHESEHARGFADETDAECNAMARLPAVLEFARVPQRLRALMWKGAVTTDGDLPAAYHAHSCSQAPRVPPAPPTTTTTTTTSTTTTTVSDSSQSCLVRPWRARSAPRRRSPVIARAACPR